MSDVNLDIDEALKSASEEVEAEESSTTEETEEEEVETPKSKETSKRGKGASDRIRTLVAEQKQLQEELEKAKSTLSERDVELGKLVDMIQARDNDAQVVSKINELYQNPEYKPFIEYLDKLVRGEEVESKPEFSSKEAKKEVDNSAELLKKLDSKAAEIDDAIADREADLILRDADNIVSNWMMELPEEYGEEDKRLISRLITDQVDWDSIEEAGGENLEEELAEGWNNTLELYGQPKGLRTENDEEVEKEVDPEEEAQKLRAFVNQDWGKLKETNVGGQKVIKPVVSDDEFSQALAKVLKRGNQGF